jgi:hypothetical protein
LAHQFTLFLTWCKDLDLAKTAEIGGTLLLSFMSFDGGLNCTPPGHILWGIHSPDASAAVWKYNSEKMFVLRPHVLGVIEEDMKKMERQREIVERLGEMKALEQETNDLSKKLIKVRAEVKALDVRLEGFQAANN